MTRKDCTRARGIVADMLKVTRRGTVVHGLAAELQQLLKPQPTLGDIIRALPGETHKERAALIGLSRQGYYNLIQGTARPNTLTSRRLAELTGMTEEAIREAAP